jgi:penicillin amidase
MKHRRRRIVIGLAILFVVAGPAVFFLTFPKWNGLVRLQGLSAPVEVNRDKYGIPSIRARNLDDLFFAQGFVVAQDRLWQMEFQRRVGAGTLSEILGPKLVETDKFLRTIGFHVAAERALAETSPEGRRALESYVRGANAYLTSTHARPLEFRLLRFEPKPFTAVDLLTWMKLMEWDLGENATEEIDRSIVTAKFGAEKADQFFAKASPTPTILEDGEWSASSAPRERIVSTVASAALERMAELFNASHSLGFGGEAVGSNSWVVAGSRTKSGKPLLANDPHLGLRSPSVWYFVRLESPEIHVTGASLVGLPGVVIGHNDRIAWGLTNLGPDVQDLYVEKTDDTHPDSYLFKGRWERFGTRRESIAVKGGLPVALTVRQSVHGPVVSDVLTNAKQVGPAVTLRWTATAPEIPDRALDVFLTIARAGNWSEFLAGVEKFTAPAQNFVYADVDGHIGYTASGLVPIRPRASGLLPVSGEGDDEWSGFIPWADLPRTIDPPRGFIVTANNAVVSDRYPYSLSESWPEPFRATRITDLIRAGRNLAPGDMTSIELDQHSLQAELMIPVLADTHPRDSESKALLQLLSGWNRVTSEDSAGAAAYASWYTELVRVFSARVSPARATPRTRFLASVLRPGSPESGWCDDPATSAVETCGDLKSETLARAAEHLSAKLGGDTESWRWGSLHRAVFPHAVLDKVSWLQPFFSPSCRAGGDGSTVDVGSYDYDGSFRMHHGASLRFVADLAEPDDTRLVLTTGESGNVLSPRYRDQMELWRTGRSIRADREPAVYRLVLLPALLRSGA